VREDQNEGPVGLARSQRIPKYPAGHTQPQMKNQYFGDINGLEVRSRPAGRKGSSKYVTWGEVRELWGMGCSILIYRHWRRESRETFAGRMVSDLRRHTGALFTAALRTSHVLYLLAAQERHAVQCQEAVSLLPQRWNGQIEPMRRR
jgi:hypothetical protein